MDHQLCTLPTDREDKHTSLVLWNYYAAITIWIVVVVALEVLLVVSSELSSKQWLLSHAHGIVMVMLVPHSGTGGVRGHISP